MKDAEKELLRSLLAADRAWIATHPGAWQLLKALKDSVRNVKIHPTQLPQGQRILGNVFVHVQVLDNPHVPRRQKPEATIAYLAGLLHGLELGLHHRSLLQELGIDV